MTNPLSSKATPVGSSALLFGFLPTVTKILSAIISSGLVTSFAFLSTKNNLTLPSFVSSDPLAKTPVWTLILFLNQWFPVKKFNYLPSPEDDLFDIKPKFLSQLNEILEDEEEYDEEDD